MSDVTLQVWALALLVVLGAHLLVTLTQGYALWWAWRQPNHRHPRHFRKARRRLILTLSLILAAAAAITTIYLLLQNHVQT